MIIDNSSKNDFPNFYFFLLKAKSFFAKLTMETPENTYKAAENK